MYLFSSHYPTVFILLRLFSSLLSYRVCVILQSFLFHLVFFIFTFDEIKFLNSYKMTLYSLDYGPIDDRHGLHWMVSGNMFSFCFVFHTHNTCMCKQQQFPHQKKLYLQIQLELKIRRVCPMLKVIYYSYCISHEYIPLFNTNTNLCPAKTRKEL